MQGRCIQSLTGELRSHMPHSAAKKYSKFLKIKIKGLIKEKAQWDFYFCRKRTFKDGNQGIKFEGNSDVVYFTQGKK